MIKPAHWRNGQTLVNFISWLQKHKDIDLDQLFYITDDQYKIYYIDFLTEYNEQEKTD